jgi:hypothetical protein
LLAATCLHIASKIEDNEAITVKELHYCADRTYDVVDIVNLEERVLEEIGWNVTPTTINDFHSTYLDCLAKDTNDESFWLSRYLSEIALQSQLHLKYSPSIIAASVVVLSRYSSLYRNNSLPPELERLTGYTMKDLGECIIDLSKYHCSINSELKIIPIRYKKARRGALHMSNIQKVQVVSDLEKMHTGNSKAY